MEFLEELTAITDLNNSADELENLTDIFEDINIHSSYALSQIKKAEHLFLEILPCNIKLLS